MDQLIAYLTLLFGVMTVPAPVVGTLKAEQAEPYMQYACEFVGGECPETPLVIFTPTRVNNLGYHYRGSHYVAITDRCLFGLVGYNKCEAVVVHEMIHYIVGQQGRYANSCDNERIAWSAYNNFVFDIGRGDLYNPNWRRNYPKCQITASVAPMTSQL